MPKAGAKKTTGKKRSGAEATKPAQHRFLTDMAKEGRMVAIFLVNGLKLEGKIASFDEYAILLEGEMSDHVYKHAISTIQPLSGVVAKAGVRAKPVATHSAVEVAVAARERKPRQPTIVVRQRRRVVKNDAGES